MRNSLRGRALAVLAIGATLTGGVAAASAAGTVTDAEDQSPPILNNVLLSGSTVVGARVTIGNIYQSLFTANAAGGYSPVLATHVPSGKDISLKGKKFSVTFEIRPDAKWSDGKPLTADDAIFTYGLMINKKNEIASRSGWDQIKRIKKLSRTKFRVDFKVPYAAWKDNWCTCGGYAIYPKHQLQGKDFNTYLNNGNLLGSGPFVLTSYKQDESAVLSPNKNYWDKKKKPKISQIAFNFVGSTTSQAAALKSGEANLINPPPNFDLVNGIVQDNPGAVVQSKPAATFEHIAINTSVTPLDDVNVRQALAYAIDRGGITSKLLAGVVKPLESPLVPYQLGYKPSFARYTYNPAKARQILEADGWKMGSDGIYAKGGQRLSLTLKTTSGNAQRQRNIAYLAQQAKPAGIELVYAAEPNTKLFGSTLPDGDYQLANFAFSGSTDPTQTFLFGSAFIPGPSNGNSGQNYYRISDKTLDKLLVASDQAIDTKPRVKLIGQWQDRMAKLVPLIPLYQRPNVVAAVKALKGVQENPTQSEVYWNSNVWSFGKS